MEHMKLLLNAIYADQHSFGLYGHNIMAKLYYPLSHAQDMSWNNFEWWNNLTTHSVKSDNDFIVQTWRDAYRAVQHCNNFMGELPEFREEYADEGDMRELELMEGQARFMRAWYYFILLRVWGEDITEGSSMGVPLILDVPDNRQAMYVERASVNEVYDQIVSDLNQAETLLEGHVWEDEKTRVDEWSVKGLLGKVHVFRENWSDAQTYLEDVINNSGKELVSYDTYKTMFNGNNEINSESLFQINLTVDKNTWGAWGPSTGSGNGMVIGPCYMTDDGGTGSSGWSNVFVHDKNLQRFGYTLEDVEMVDNPNYDPDQPESRTNLEKIPDPELIEDAREVRENNVTDPRLHVSTLQPYLDSMMAGGTQTPIVTYKEIEEDKYGWSFRKYVNLDGTEYEVNVNNGSNFYILRLADIYLLYAETLINGNGDQATALEYINKVKRRAYGYNPNSSSPVDYSSLSDDTKASDPVLGNDPLKYERWAELFAEGHWWFDVRRWKIGSGEATYYERTRGGEISFEESIDYAMPIPQDEVETNQAIEQNPGYK